MSTIADSSLREGNAVTVRKVHTPFTKQLLTTIERINNVAALYETPFQFASSHRHAGSRLTEESAETSTLEILTGGDVLVVDEVQGRFPFSPNSGDRPPVAHSRDLHGQGPARFRRTETTHTAAYTILEANHRNANRAGA